mgnify:CR=1 FL=1
MNGSIHLGRNIRSISVNLYNFYEKNRRLVITEQEFLDACREFINDATITVGKTTI